MEINDDAVIQSALRLYKSHQKAKKVYYQKNQEKMRDYGKSYYQKIKEDPDKYKEYLERCNQKYERIKDDPEKLAVYLEKSRARYYAKKEEKESVV